MKGSVECSEFDIYYGDDNDALVPRATFFYSEKSLKLLIPSRYGWLNCGCCRIHCDEVEAFYNIARAYHHVGLVSLAASYYEKVLAISVEDYPLPELSEEDHLLEKDLKPGYCDLRREAL
ncbi:hypothetical protein Ancab_007141 [Ancistrocladus abbreviatus]